MNSKGNLPVFDSNFTSNPSKPVCHVENRQALGNAISTALQNNGSMQQAFFDLYQAAESEIRRLVRYWSLKLVVEEEQIKNTVTDFIEDFSGSPDENPFLARLMAMKLRQPANLLDQLQFYASRRLFTLLKRNASKASQEYLTFNNLIKKNLGDLAEEGQIKLVATSYWTAGDSKKSIAADTALLSPSVLARLPLQRTIDQAGRQICRNVKPSLLQLLNSPEHICYRFRTSSISSALFNLDASPLYYLTYMNDNHESLQAIHAQQTCECNAMAGCMLEQVWLQIPDQDRLQILMAGLAYCFIVCPDYFDQNDFSADHIAILTAKKGEIDRIHEFLNTKPLSDLFNKEPGRSTVYNRVSSFKTLLESSLVDFPVEAQQAGIKGLANILICHYQKLSGGAK